ncbi:MAG: FixH family protein [Lentisphaerae bacterium]|nr:FixH family protein [Lentisphaerota bacterium]
MTSANLWPRAIIAFYGLFVVAVVAFTIFASRQPSDLVSPDYYARELRHQDHIDSEQRGLAASTYTFTGDEAARRFTLRFPSPSVGGSIVLYRPSAAALDRTIPIQTDSNAVQVVDASTCAPGLWRVQVEWTQDGHTFSREHSVVLP